MSSSTNIFTNGWLNHQHPITSHTSTTQRPSSKGRCSGKVDPNRKGGSCTAISQDMVVVSGVGIADKRDPRGAWRLARKLDDLTK